MQYLPNFLGWESSGFTAQVDPQQADDAVRGLAGLIVLGNAWESVDVFHALNVALQHDTLGFARERNGGRNTLAYFAWLRCRDLIDAGKGSMLPDAPKGQDLKSVLPRPGYVEADRLLDPAFAKLRAEANAWNADRTAFLMRRLGEGRHPDTDPEFWNGYNDRPAPSLPVVSVPHAFYARQALRRELALLVVIGVPVLLVLVALVSRALGSARDRQRKPRPAEDPLAESLGEPL